MMITRFEEIAAWQKARVFNKSIYELTRRKEMTRDFGMVDQLRRASVSVMNNIAEGFERYRRAEFLQYLSMAKASAGEVRSMLYVAFDVGYISKDEFASLLVQAQDVAGTIGRFRTRLERSKPKPLGRPAPRKTPPSSTNHQ